MNKADEKLNRHHVTSKLNPILNHSTPPTVLVNKISKIRLVQYFYANNIIRLVKLCKVLFKKNPISIIRIRWKMLNSAQQASV
uniref:Uncharacterized protein n=1 Tax=Setaria italica TaxID=4555 RepID=K3XNU8_SETIT